VSTGPTAGPGTDPAGTLRATGRELERLADRLRTLGPRHAARAATDRRSAAAVLAVRQALDELADVAARAEDRRTPPVPELAAHALADQLLVLGRDALAPDPSRERVESVRRVLTRVRRAL